MKVQNPFSITGWPLTWYPVVIGESLSGELFAAVANTYTLIGFSLLAQVTANSINLLTQNVASPGTYSVGLYNAAGTLVCHSAPGAVTPNTNQAFALVGGPIRLNPGSYYFASTGDNISAGYFKTGGSATAWTFFYGNSLGATVGGALPATIVPPAQSIDVQHAPLFALSI